MRRGQVRLAAQRPKLLDDVSGERVRDRLRRHAQVEARRSSGASSERGKAQTMSSNSSSVSPTSGPRSSAPSASVSRRSARTGDGDEVLDLLAPVEALAGLRGDGDAALLEGFLVAPEFAAGRRKQRDIAGPARALPAAPRVADRLAADQARAHVGDGLGLAVPLPCGGCLAVFVRHRDVEGGDRRSLRPAPAETGSRAWNPGWPFSSESGASNRAFTYSMIGGQERKLVAMESTPSAACARNASRAVT